MIRFVESVEAIVDDDKFEMREGLIEDRSDSLPDKAVGVEHGKATETSIFRSFMIATEPIVEACRLEGMLSPSPKKGAAPAIIPGIPPDAEYIRPPVA